MLNKFKALIKIKIFHLDIKLDNVAYRKHENEFFFADWGLAKCLSNSDTYQRNSKNISSYYNWFQRYVVPKNNHDDKIFTVFNDILKYCMEKKSAEHFFIMYDRIRFLEFIIKPFFPNTQAFYTHYYLLFKKESEDIFLKIMFDENSSII
jgi:capsule polysaccharide export protein KpsC/LpsZ